MKKFNSEFSRGDNGSISIVAMLLFVAFAAFAAIGIDFAKLRSDRTLMQSTADAAAHAAIYMRELNDADTAKAAALEVVEAMMPFDDYKTVVSENDITFGDFDYETRSFTADEDAKGAVRVNIHRDEASGNGISTYLFKLVGIDTFDTNLDSVFVTYVPTCFIEGFVADEKVDIQSNNSYFNGFCIHANGGVSINSNNFFESGTVVSMTDLDDLELPQSGDESNDGLDEALREAAYRIRVVNRLPDMIDSLMAGEDTYLQSYTTAPFPVPVYGNQIDVSTLLPGLVYYLTCPGAKATLRGDYLEGVVLLTSCEVKFDQGIQIVDSLLVTTSTSKSSFNSPASLVLGLDDDCAPGGGAVILTMGGVSFTSDLHMYGSQIIANSDVEFSANADGIEGASIISGGTISGTSNMNMGFCGDGMEYNYSAEYFRMAF
ncbi:pilus assembly protein TadG-related protein [Celeribacter sp. ASW11-22]|nr:pilus assembly protein TadG-related protein [Celeribacter litoreus]